jgi:hypothetical protein
LSARAAWLAWSAWALAVVVLALGFMLPPVDVGATFLLAIAFPFTTVGAFVASRRPANPIGWLFVGFGAVAAFTFFTNHYAVYALVTRPGSLPGGDLAASVAVHVWHPAFALFILSFLLFPHGRLLSPRWRVVAWVTVAGSLVGLAGGMLESEFQRSEGVRAAEPLVTGPVAEVAAMVFGVFLMVNLLMLALSGVSLVLRLRRSAGEERQQLKLFVYAVALFALALPTSVLVFGDGRMGVLFLPLVPGAAGVAILRYRLYDIDLLINRTLVYGSLTAMLALVYFGGVTLLQSILRTLTGQESTLAVVASTLAIAALFNPLRRRVQAFVDRRFYRRKYDAAKTLAAFGSRLRNETDLEALGDDLVGVTSATMQPEHVSLWLRPEAVQRAD